MQHELEPLLFSISDAAKSLGVSHWTVRHLLRTRQLSRVRIGSRVLISAAELNRFIKERTEDAVYAHSPKIGLGDVPTPR
jgi:excisionase family DNA binding protein